MEDVAAVDFAGEDFAAVDFGVDFGVEDFTVEAFDDDFFGAAAFAEVVVDAGFFAAVVERACAAFTSADLGARAAVAFFC
ncbi:hypothetical protein [Microbacterium sp. A94]|uniref:hypothetical protein n=1 Tax=Microbacterium sp. A94 TaxID=3450717 RepID=UPI003F431738